MTADRILLQRLELPYVSMKTLYEGDCEVRLYRNSITGAEQVGKRLDILGLEQAVAVREAQLLQTIRHANIVQVFDVAEVPEYPPPMRVIELIMPFFPRGSVCDALKKGARFSVLDACLHAQAALRGLGELHEQYRILHRDLKSPNVFLSEDGSLLKVGDLGVSVPMEADSTAEAYPSSQLYSPPETFTTRRVDRRSDIYAMGLLLFELLNGPLPYDSYTREQLLARLQKGRPGPLDAHLVPAPQVPPRLRTIVRKAMARDPARRFGSAAEMAAALAATNLIDWSTTLRTDDTIVWEGACSRTRDRAFQVEARKRRKDGAWVLSARQRVSRWQKFVPDQLVAEPQGPGATAFFDQVLKIATSR